MEKLFTKNVNIKDSNLHENLISYYFILGVDLYSNISSLSIPLARPVLQFQT